MVVGASCSGGIRLTSDAARACCEVTTGSSALSCANDPGSASMLAGGATSCVSFGYTWDTGIVVTGTVSGANPCEPDIG